MATFGELLSELRKDHNLTQKQLADLFHVSVGTISNYENDVHMPDVEKLIAIADYFEVTTDYLLSRTSYSMSPAVLEAVILNGRPVHEVINNLKALSVDQQKAVDVLLEDMRFKAEVLRRS